MTLPSGETPRPNVFVASSSEGLAIAEAIAAGVAPVAEATLWPEKTLPLSKATLEGLMEALDRFDFGIFVFTPDDEIQSRGETFSAPRANVVFELGLFMGRLGRGRCFIVCERDLAPAIFSDMNGITFAGYTPPAESSTIAAAVASACSRISTAITMSGPLRKGADFLPAYLQPFFKDRFRAIMGSIRTFDTFEPSGLIGLGDAMGLAELRAYFDTLGIRDFPLLFSEIAHDDRLRGNVLLIGGPGPNEVTREALKRLPTHIRAAPNGTYYAFHDPQTGISYEPKFGEGGRVESDAGLIISSANPFDPQHRSIIIYGITGYGTWSAARFFASEGFEAVVQGDSSFEVLVVGDIVRGTPQTVEAAAVWRSGSD